MHLVVLVVKTNGALSGHFMKLFINYRSFYISASEPHKPQHKTQADI